MPTEAQERKAAAVSGAEDPAQAVIAERERNERIEKDKERLAAERAESGDEAGNSQRQAVEDVARGEGNGENGEITQQQAMDAADWFLHPDPEEDVSTKRFRLRVGKPGSPREYVYWTVKSLGRERIQQIREQEKRPGRKRGEAAVTDEVSANLRIAAEATVEPNLMEVKGGRIDPADALNARFAFKPGLIDQIAAEAIAVTGYSDDDVDEITAVKKLVARGGEAWLLFQTVRLLGRDPFQVYNDLDESYRPIGGPQPRPLRDPETGEVIRDPETGEAKTEISWDPVYPKYPNRVRVFLYGLGAAAAEEDMNKTKAIAGVPIRRAMGG